jgi:hypothetical protein
MSLHNVSTKTGIRLHRTFKVHLVSRLQLCKTGAPLRFAKDIGGEASRIAPGDGQARAVDGNRFARHKRFTPWLERELNH